MKHQYHGMTFPSNEQAVAWVLRESGKIERNEVVNLVPSYPRPDQATFMIPLYEPIQRYHPQDLAAPVMATTVCLERSRLRVENKFFPYWLGKFEGEYFYTAFPTPDYRPSKEVQSMHWEYKLYCLRRAIEAEHGLRVADRIMKLVEKELL